MKKLLLLILVVFLCWSVCGQAQQWKIWNTTNSNIPSNSLNNLIIDSIGIVWIGSANAGLIRFDGTNFTTYNTSNSPMQSNWVRSMAIDRLGNLWLCAFSQGAGNEGALMKFDRVNNWSYYNSQNSDITHGNQFSVTVDTNNIVWSFYTSLNRFDGTNWREYDSTNSPLKASTVFEMYTDRKNNKWIGLNFYGLYKFENDSMWTVYNPANSGIGGAVITKIREDNLGNYWINISASGLCKHSPLNNSWQNWTPQNSNLVYGYPKGLCIDKNNIPWLGFDADLGLAEFNGTKFIYYNPPIATIISDIKEDIFGNLWLTTSEGLMEFNINGIVGISENNSAINNFTLNQNYPNPFNPSTIISYSLKKSSSIELKLFDINGRMIKIIESGFKHAGSYEINFSAEGLSSGVYFFSLYSEGILMDTKKAIVLK